MPARSRRARQAEKVRHEVRSSGFEVPKTSNFGPRTFPCLARPASHPELRTSLPVPIICATLASLSQIMRSQPPTLSDRLSYWPFEQKENRLNNHTPQGKLPPQPIVTTIHSSQPYQDVRRVLLRGEVREWPNRAVSKTAVLATGPWVRSPPSPPFFTRLCIRVRVIPARFLLKCHRECYHC